MWYLIIYASLLIFSYIGLKKMLGEDFVRAKSNYERTRLMQERLIERNESIRQANLNLQKNLEQTIAIYDIAKEINRSLELDKVFSYFKDELGKYLTLSDCRFLKKEEELLPYKDYFILPLEIDKNNLIGYLIADGIKKEDKEKFNILVQQFLLGVKRAALYQRLQELAITDTLTGIFTRRYYLERFAEELNRSKKFNFSFACLMIDIDHFKDYNDHYGHLVGDAVLKEVANVIKENTRQIDLFGRYGGEEFSVVLTETGRSQAQFVAERIRQAIENKSVRIYDEDLKIKISVGFCVFPDDAQSMQSLIDKADSALYQAKQTGRNKVCMYRAQR